MTVSSSERARRGRQVAGLLLVAVAYVAALPVDALAYIDPGTGSMILQLLAAGLVTVSVVFRRSIARVFGIFRKGKRPPNQ